MVLTHVGRIVCARGRAAGRKGGGLWHAGAVGSRVLPSVRGRRRDAEARTDSFLLRFQRARASPPPPHTLNHVAASHHHAQHHHAAGVGQDCGRVFCVRGEQVRGRQLEGAGLARGASFASRAGWHAHPEARRGGGPRRRGRARRASNTSRCAGSTDRLTRSRGEEQRVLSSVWAPATDPPHTPPPQQHPVPARRVPARIVPAAQAVRAQRHGDGGRQAVQVSGHRAGACGR